MWTGRNGLIIVYGPESTVKVNVRDLICDKDEDSETISLLLKGVFVRVIARLNVDETRL